MKSKTDQSPRNRSRSRSRRSTRKSLSPRQLQNNIGMVLRTARDAKDWTQEDVADQVGVTSEFYARVERGHTMPGLTTLIKLAGLFHIEVDVLLGFEELGPLNLTADEEPKRYRKLARRIRKTPRKHLRLLDKVVSAVEQAQAGGKANRGRRS